MNQKLPTKIRTSFINNRILIFISFLTIFFLLWNLHKSMFNDDAHFWYLRSQNFIQAVQFGELRDTFQNPKPGVTVMWLTGGADFIFYKVYVALNHWDPPMYFAPVFPLYQTITKLPLILLSFISLISVYIVTLRLFSRKVALWTLFILSIEPFYIGISQWMHVDGTLTAFMTMSALLALYSVIEKKSYRYFVLSGILGGLALLTKTQALFLFLYLPLIFCINSGLHRDFSPKDIKTAFKITMIWVLTALITFVVLFPAMWADPAGTIRQIFQESLRVVTTGQNGIGDNHNVWWYFFVLPLRTSPLLLVSSLVGLSLMPTALTKSKENKLALLGILGFVFFYFAMMEIPAQKIDRYLLPLFPFLAIIGGFVLAKSKTRRFLMIIVTSSLLFSVSYLNDLNTYFNPMVGGRKIAEKFYFLETKGEALPPVGYYLSQKEGSSEQTIMVTSLPQSIRPFYTGTVLDINETPKKGVTIDYAVAPWNVELPTKLSTCTHEKDFSSHNNLWWRVYKCPQLIMPEE